MARSAGGVRRLDWPECVNTRDLGGLTSRTGLTRSRVLIRSDEVTHLNPVGIKALSDYGVAAVLDLRSAGELGRRPSPFADNSTGPTYIHRELIDDANMAQIGESEDMFDRYLFIVNQRPAAFRDVFETIAGTDGTVLFHCFAGKDRTGLVAAMLLELAGVSDDVIAADYGETDVHLAPKYAQWIDEAPAERREAFRAELRCPPERIIGILEHLRRSWGGVAGYLEAAGTAPGTIDRVAAKLT